MHWKSRIPDDYIVKPKSLPRLTQEDRKMLEWMVKHEGIALAEELDPFESMARGSVCGRRTRLTQLGMIYTNTGRIFEITRCGRKALENPPKPDRRKDRRRRRDQHER